MTEFYSERTIKATRKQHTCDSCETRIEIRSPAKYLALKHDGDFWAAHFHVDCRAAEIEWNRANDLWGDEFTNLWMLCEEVNELGPVPEGLWDRYPEVFQRVAHRLPSSEGEEDACAGS